MPALHIIDAARIAHDTCRSFFPTVRIATSRAAWSDLPVDQRQNAIETAQNIIDGGPRALLIDPAANHLRVAVVNALRPFLEE
jgi:hypothetical protein